MTRTPVRLFGLALAILMLASTGDGLAQRKRGNKNNGCHSIRVSSPEAPIKNNRRRRHRRRPSFSAAEILDIEFQVLLPRKPTGDHVLQLKLYTPKGHLYQTLSVPFSAEEGSDEQATTRSPRRRRRGHKVGTTLPVAGTTIVTSSLYGTWKVEAYLDGAQEACTRAKKFKINP